jgi:hypothetical protein
MQLKILGFWMEGVAELGRKAGVAVSQNITVPHIAGRPIVGLFAGDGFVQTEFIFIIYACLQLFERNEPDLKGNGYAQGRHITVKMAFLERRIKEFCSRV